MSVSTRRIPIHISPLDEINEIHSLASSSQLRSRASPKVPALQALPALAQSTSQESPFAPRSQKNMDFIQNVGQSYLERKAFGAPQMAENAMLKQFKGGGDKNEEDDDPKAKAKATTAAAASSKKGSTTDKDAEIKSLRKQLDHYSLEEAAARGEHDGSERGNSVGEGARSRHVAPSYVSTHHQHQHKPSHAAEATRKRSSSEKPRSSGVYLEKGGLSRKKSNSRKPSAAAKHESGGGGAAKEAAKLVALDARLEKGGGVSTKKKARAFAEVEEAGKKQKKSRASRYDSVSESDSEDDVRSHYTSRSKATVSDASTVRASRVPSHRSSHSRGRPIEIVSPPSVISSHAPSHRSHHDSHDRAPLSIISGHAPSHRDSHAPKYHEASHTPSHTAPLAPLASNTAPSQINSKTPPSILKSQAGSHHTMASPVVIAPRHSNKSHTPSHYDKASHSASHAVPAATTIISNHSRAPSSRHVSYATSHRGPSNQVPTIRAASTRSPSPTPSDSDSDSLAPSDSITSMDVPSEHGGSAALLHQRKLYHRYASRGRLPELPPLEERPECCGPGFVPHRSRERLEEDVGIVEVEVFEGASGPAPHVREIGRGRERGWGREEGGYAGGGGRTRSVVELGKRRDGAMREKRYYKVH